MSSDVFWCHLKSSDVIWCHLMSYDVIWCHLMSYVVIWCHIMLSNTCIVPTGLLPLYCEKGKIPPCFGPKKLITPLYFHNFGFFFYWRWSIKCWSQSIATFYCCRSLVKWSKPRIIYIFFILFGLKGTNQLFATKSHLKLMKSGLFPQICPFLSTVRRKSFLPP